MEVSLKLGLIRMEAASFSNIFSLCSASLEIPCLSRESGFGAVLDLSSNHIGTYEDMGSGVCL